MKSLNLKIVDKIGYSKQNYHVDKEAKQSKGEKIERQGKHFENWFDE